MLQVIYRFPILKNWFPNGVPIYGFGLMLFCAFILCTWLAGKRGEREWIKKETIQDLAIWIFIGGLLGARITFLLQERPLPGFVEFITKLPRIWDGGIILYGSLIGALVGYSAAYLFFFRKQGLSTLRLADVIAPSIAIGLCFGRMGCFLNGCCYGQVACAECAVFPVSFPMTAPSREYLVENGSQTAAGFTLDVTSPPEGRGVKVALVNPESQAYAEGLRPGSIITAVNGNTVRRLSDLSYCQSLGPDTKNWTWGGPVLELEFEPKSGEEPRTMSISPRTLGLYPTQLYEVVSMFLLFLVLLSYDPFRKAPGQVMAVLMMGYGVHRYLNELLRDDPRPIGLERYGSYLLVCAGAVLWIWLWRKAVVPTTNSGGNVATPAAATTPA